MPSCKRSENRPRILWPNSVGALAESTIVAELAVSNFPCVLHLRCAYLDASHEQQWSQCVSNFPGVHTPSTSHLVFNSQLCRLRCKCYSNSIEFYTGGIVMNMVSFRP